MNECEAVVRHHELVQRQKLILGPKQSRNPPGASPLLCVRDRPIPRKFVDGPKRRRDKGRDFSRGNPVFRRQVGNPSADELEKSGYWLDAWNHSENLSDNGNGSSPNKTLVVSGQCSRRVRFVNQPALHSLAQSMHPRIPAIGDVHGCDALTAILRLIRRDASPQQLQQPVHGVKA